MRFKNISLILLLITHLYFIFCISMSSNLSSSSTFITQLSLKNCLTFYITRYRDSISRSFLENTGIKSTLFSIFQLFIIMSISLISSY